VAARLLSSVGGTVLQTLDRLLRLVEALIQPFHSLWKHLDQLTNGNSPLTEAPSPTEEGNHTVSGHHDSAEKTCC
jgi:hypothetical protein